MQFINIKVKGFQKVRLWNNYIDLFIRIDSRIIRNYIYFYFLQAYNLTTIVVKNYASGIK